MLPVGSEPVFVGMLLGGVGTPWLLVAVASVGNTLGSVVNWWIGRGLSKQEMFPVKHSYAFAWVRRRYASWGRWTLLLAWLPVVGDPLTLMAGAMGERLDVFLALVGVSKTCRFAALALITLNWT